MITQGHGRVVVEVINAPWAGIPVATFIDQNQTVCAPRALLGTRAIRWAIDRSS